jgi:thymidylate kinase
MSLTVTHSIPWQWPEAVRPGPSTEPLSLVGQLGEALRAAKVSYCQWKGNRKRDRWSIGQGDIDLLVDRAMVAEFAAVLRDLGFKPALPPAEWIVPGVQHYYGLDTASGRLVHVHACTRLMVGPPWRTHYRLPLERALLDTACQRAVFKTPAPEVELLALVLSQTLRRSWRDVVRPRNAVGREIQNLEEEARPKRLAQALATHLPEIDQATYDACRRALLPGASLWRRAAARIALTRRLAEHARHPSPDGALRREGAHHLAAGGAVVALLGADGAGKSTCAQSLFKWLSPHLAAVHAHFGRPPRSLLTLLAGGALRVASRLPVDGLTAHLDLLRCVCTARDRARLSRRVWRFAAGGGIAICERYPAPENWTLVGPSHVQGLALDAFSPLASALRRWEDRYYDRMPHPDVMFALRLPPALAVHRKPDEPETYVRRRAELMWEADWSRSEACVVDASQPLPQVVAALKTELWRRLA